MWCERNILVLSDNDLLLRVIEMHLRQPGLKVRGCPLTLAGAMSPKMNADLIVVALSTPSGVSLTALIEQAGQTPLLIISDRRLDWRPAEHVHCLTLPFDAVALRRQVGALLGANGGGK